MHDAAALLTAASRALARLPVALDALLTDLPPDLWRARPAPAEWSAVEIVCHLRDEEREDFRARTQVVVAGGDVFGPIDPERWAVDRRYRDADPGAALAELRQARADSLAWLVTIPAERLTGAVTHPRIGRLSGLDLLAAWTTHDALHLAQLSATLARVWADRWAPLRVEYAGPIPYAPDRAGSA